MGKAPKWLPQEREVAALAWIRATNDGIEGADQRGSIFQEKVHSLFKVLTPANAPPDRYGDRAAKTVYIFLRDHIFPDVNKFNESLRLVQSSHPTGVTDDNIISMAVAVHLKETDRMNYQYKNYDPTKWPNFLAWKLLRNVPKFRPPSTGLRGQQLPPFKTNNIAAASNPDPLAVAEEVLPISATDMAPSISKNTNATTDAVSVQETAAALISSNIASCSSNIASCSSNTAMLLQTVDPSRGGRGCSVGRKKAKREAEFRVMHDEKMKRLKVLENIMKEHKDQQVRTGRAIELRQIMKAAIACGNKQLVKEIQVKMMALYSSGEDNLVGTMSSTIELANSTSTESTSSLSEG
jgi:hypothetical protein